MRIFKIIYSCCRNYVNKIFFQNNLTFQRIFSTSIFSTNKNSLNKKKPKTVNYKNYVIPKIIMCFFIYMKRSIRRRYHPRKEFRVK